MINEKNCLEAITNGSEEALEQLYNEYADRVYNTLISYTKNSEDAEELLQDVFVTLYNSAGNFEHNSAVSTWIYRIAVNKALDFIRKRKSKKRFGSFTSLYSKESGEMKYDSVEFVHPGIQMENKEDAGFLFGALEVLPEKQKTAFILTQIEGLPQNKVAEIMSQSRKSVESLVQRAKANLKVELKKFFPERGKK
ncbi:RNA polymerase sigma factor [Marivirga tractuosa]|uniref:RNA polymerase, sigma-24 subunit, ECF subfamily n=1 Tax=Marivirga tractuosa (strain ATCC 23168 / DSM 4126 / NBRC 15989 / NCIMB 1408 / VKM B-1430 / H-43) TaxID=643867 RepID=E4TKR8_MARTH|nr:RNA polymerase sigma factor [Marivirga tractuosa]ADR21234.1 RNA polymerase, sigma-24 subunit, ECF subfamily [Marivirga tractuosa DSM 4126]BDD14312.1 RNA polymerase sigma factor [Marivirga tractuosa]